MLSGHALGNCVDDLGLGLIEPGRQRIVPTCMDKCAVGKIKLPEGLYCRDLRNSDDDSGLSVTIQEHAVVNHAAKAGRNHRRAVRGTGTCAGL